MIFLIPYLTSITALMVVVFVGALAAGYVSAGSERISYAGFQIAFAFFLCVIQGSSPAFDLSTARDRVIGILLGNVVAYLVVYQCLASQRRQAHRSGNCRTLAPARRPDDRG